MQQAHEKCTWFRRLCFRITGWQIDACQDSQGKKTYRLFSKYNRNEHLLLVDNVHGFDLLQSPLVDNLDPSKIQDIIQMGGIPYLLGNLTTALCELQSNK